MPMNAKYVAGFFGLGLLVFFWGRGDLYNLREGGWKMNAHNRIIRYSQGFKRVAVCLGVGGEADVVIKAEPEGRRKSQPHCPEWPRVCAVTRIFCGVTRIFCGVTRIFCGVTPIFCGVTRILIPRPRSRDRAHCTHPATFVC